MHALGGVAGASPAEPCPAPFNPRLHRCTPPAPPQKYRMRLKRGEEVEGQGMNSPLQGSWYECTLTPQAPPEAADAAQGPGEP